MAKIAQKRMSWDTPLAAHNVVSHYVYCVPESQPINYDSTRVEIQMPTCEYIFAGIFEISEGNYKIGLSAKDSFSNISDISQVTIFFDMTAPPIPSGIKFSDL